MLNLGLISAYYLRVIVLILCGCFLLPVLSSLHCGYQPELRAVPLPTFHLPSFDSAHPTVRIMDMIKSAATDITIADDNHTSCMQWKCKTRSGECEYCLPSIFIAGVSKAGTSALFDKLANHPDTQGYWAKELDLFNTRASGGFTFQNLSAFEHRFGKYAKGGTQKYYLDASVGSIRDLQSIHMLKRYAPHAKIVVLVRDMRARLVSWLAMVSHGKDGSGDIEKHSVERGRVMIEQFRKATASYPKLWQSSAEHIDSAIFHGPMLGYFLLGEILLPWVQSFRSNILIVDHAELLHRPLDTLRRIEQFVGLSHHAYAEEVLKSVTNVRGHYGWNDHESSGAQTAETMQLSFGEYDDAYLHDLMSKSACVMEKLIGWAPDYEE